MTEQLGVVFSVDADQAIYLSYPDVDACRSLAEAFGQVPTVAGPALDLVVLERLRDALIEARSAEVHPPEGHRLSVAEAEYLALLQVQGALRATLPLRLHRTCTACGTKKIINPARPKASTVEKAGTVATVISGLATLADDPVSGFVDIMKGMGGKQSTAVLCEYCEGFEFELPAVTFCPSCKALRTEAVLITCPDCQNDFAAPEARRPWVALADARDSARLAGYQVAVRAACGRLAGGLYGAQQGLLLGALTSADEPRCLFRSSRPGDSTRSTVLLATADRLILVRETMAGKATMDTLPWRDVTGVYHYLTVKGGKDTTIQLDRRDGDPLVLSRVGEAGQSVTPPGPVDVVAVARELAALARVPLQNAPTPTPVAAVPAQPVPAQPVPAQPVPTQPVPTHPGPAQPAPTPTPPSGLPSQPGPPTAGAGAAVPSGPPRPPSEAPGWYPDPWSQARIRWWDGTAWTSHLNA